MIDLIDSRHLKLIGKNRNVDYAASDSSTWHRLSTFQITEIMLTKLLVYTNTLIHWHLNVLSHLFDGKKWPIMKRRNWYHSWCKLRTLFSKCQFEANLRFLIEAEKKCQEKRTCDFIATYAVAICKIPSIQPMFISNSMEFPFNVKSIFHFVHQIDSLQLYY